MNLKEIDYNKLRKVYRDKSDELRDIKKQLEDIEEINYSKKHPEKYQEWLNFRNAKYLICKYESTKTWYKFSLLKIEKQSFCTYVNPIDIYVSGISYEYDHQSVKTSEFSSDTCVIDVNFNSDMFTVISEQKFNELYKELQDKKEHTINVLKVFNYE